MTIEIRSGSSSQIGVALRAFLVALCLLMQGCAPIVSNVESQKNPAFQENFSRIFVATDVADPLGLNFAHLLGSAIQSRLNASGVASEVATLTGLELTDLEAEADAYKPDGVLVIRTAGGTIADTSAVINVVYDVSLYYHAQRKRVWRAKFDFAPRGWLTSDQERAATIADTIASALKGQGLIR